MNTRTKWIALGAATLAAVALAWWGTERRAPSGQEAPAVSGMGDTGAMGEKRDTGASAQKGPQEPKILYWYDPMHAEVHLDKPGKSPYMDMDLVPKYAGKSAAADDGTTVEVDPAMAQNLGIRTSKVTRGSMAHSVDAVGAVEVDERLIYAVESRAEGWVERLAVRAVGEPVKLGQLLAGVYSPELYSAQEELALATKSGDAGLVAASRQRLSLLGMPEAQIERVQKSGQTQREVQLVSPRAGVVTELNAREGQKVMPGTPLMRIADLSRVWITVEIPESLAAAVSPGRSAEASLSGVPGKMLEGRVEYVYPNLDSATRTVRARIVFENRTGVLKPGMYARVSIVAGGQADALLVPFEAVIRTGRRNVVIVAEGAGRFRPAEVTLGPEHESEVVILHGLEEGQDVVTSGQFLIDSEASVSGAYERLEGEAAPTPSHAHGAPKEKQP